MKRKESTMPDCCDLDSICPTNTNKDSCPVNIKYTEVSLQTVLLHIKSPWKQSIKLQRYYFCSSPDCNVVYFGEDDSVITTDELRAPVGQKQTGKDKLICYCFGVTLADVENNPDVEKFVVMQTKSGNCACKTRNPSGRCCLKEFKTIVSGK